MNRSGIEYCDHTMNFITGCRHGCPYCYARRMVQRFSGDVRENRQRTDAFRTDGDGLYVLDSAFRGDNGSIIVYPFGFEPTFHRYRFASLDTLGLGRNIFVGAMADMFGEWVPGEWIGQVFSACAGRPQHNYLFLTKNPERYYRLLLRGALPDEFNFWYGVTIDSNAAMAKCGNLVTDRNVFISFEPLLERLDFPPADWGRVSWFIIGAETGNRKGKVVPEPGWVEDICRIADQFGIPVFMKDSMIPIIGESGMRREYPEPLKKHRQSPRAEDRESITCLACGKKVKRKGTVTIQARAERHGVTKTVGNMCRACYVAWCRSAGAEAYEKELYGE